MSKAHRELRIKLKHETSALLFYKYFLTLQAMKEE